ncbi:hypothetical protein LTR64_000425 [Lithohypha guttulata]|uniref:uncharacterized protein n=1 Tax=Lithohypha guttulata TaxID=1690604 RepID=UPI002DDE20DA|nr:hypothetical protein LTR51_005809 [Lithohypha guttulata]
MIQNTTHNSSSLDHTSKQTADMLPPIPTATLEANPHFAVLYNYLTTNILLSDGSTASRSKTSEVSRVSLRQAREDAAKESVLLLALEELALCEDVTEQPSQPLVSLDASRLAGHNGYRAEGTPSLPVELRELVLNVTNYLSVSLDQRANMTLPKDTDELMREEQEMFQQYLPEICSALSRYLVSIESKLASTARTLLPPTTEQKPTRSKPRQESLSDIVSSATTLTNNLQSVQLPAQLQATLSSLQSHLDSHRIDLQNRIRHLELHTHGTQSRYLTARAAYLAAVSRGVEAKARLTKLEQEKALLENVDVMRQMDGQLERLEFEEQQLDGKVDELEKLLKQHETKGQAADKGAWKVRR